MARAVHLAFLVSGMLLAQAIPKRPEQIAFRPLAFPAPRAEAFRAKLKNGIHVYIAADPKGVPFVRLAILFKGGSYLDPKGKEGLAVLTGSQMRAGGTAEISADTLDERVEFLAGRIQSGIGETYGNISMAFLEKDLPQGMEMFMQVLTRPAFAQGRLDQAKAAMIEGLKARNDRVPELARAEMARLLNGENHFTSAQPTADSLAAITREDLVALHAQMLQPKNMVVAVSGRFKREDMLILLNRTLGNLKPGGPALPSPIPPTFQSKPGVYLVNKDVPQSIVTLALPGLRRTDPDWYAAVVMNQILGGSGFTSRLTKKIRSDEGLTYGISTSFDEGTYWKGKWNCSFQTKNQSVAYALRLALAEVEGIKSMPVPDEELKVIKDSIIQAFPMQWGRKGTAATTFAMEDLCGWPDNWWADYREKIQAVTTSDIQRVARKYLAINRLIILIVGKIAEVEVGDYKDHPGLLRDVVQLPVLSMPLRNPLTLKPIL